MALKDFLKPIVLGENRHYIGKKNHRILTIVYIVSLTILFIALYAWSGFNHTFVLFWLIAILSTLIYQATADKISDKITYRATTSLLGESKIDSNPQIHEAIKQLESDSSLQNKKTVETLIKK